MTRFALALLLGAAACSANGPGADRRDADAAGLTAPTSPSAAKLEFSARVVEPGAPPRAGVTAEGGAGRITVRGQLDTPNPCQKVTGTLTEAGSELMLRVESVRVGEMCVASIGSFTYDAAVTGVAPGSYRLRVVHAFPQTGWETQSALQQTVQVR